MPSKHLVPSRKVTHLVLSDIITLFYPKFVYLISNIDQYGYEKNHLEFDFWCGARVGGAKTLKLLHF